MSPLLSFFYVANESEITSVAGACLPMQLQATAVRSVIFPRPTGINLA